VNSTVAEATRPDVGDAYRDNAADLIRYATVLVGPSDAPDVLNDAVLGVMSSGKWDGVDNPRGYLFRAVLNQAITHKRSGARRRRREERSPSTATVAPAADASSIDAHRALAQLSEQQRAVVYLTYWDDQTPTQIATLLHISEGSVKKQLARAREQLRRILDA
jgi:RNA polymerase sigma-70 factor (ECF subfamily)